MISSIEQKTEASARKQQLAREYRERVEKELREICYEVLVSLQHFTDVKNVCMYDKNLPHFILKSMFYLKNKYFLKLRYFELKLYTCVHTHICTMMFIPFLMLKF